MPKRDYKLLVSLTSSKYMIRAQTATKDAGKYIRVTTVTTRTVALSSTVSLVRLKIRRLMERAVDWPLRLRATASCRKMLSQFWTFLSPRNGDLLSRQSLVSSFQVTLRWLGVLQYGFRMLLAHLESGSSGAPYIISFHVIFRKASSRKRELQESNATLVIWVEFCSADHAALARCLCLVHGFQPLRSLTTGQCKPIMRS